MNKHIKEVIKNPNTSNNNIEGICIKTDIPCPICNQDITVTNYGVGIPYTGPSVFKVLIGCRECCAMSTWGISTDVTLEEFMKIVSIGMIPGWIKDFKNDDDIHAWRRQCLYYIVNGMEPLSYGTYMCYERAKTSNRRTDCDINEGEED